MRWLGKTHTHTHTSSDIHTKIKVTPTLAERRDMLTETYKDTTCCHRTLKHAKIQPMHMYTHTGLEGKPREEDEEISFSSMVLTDPADV